MRFSAFFLLAISVWTVRAITADDIASSLANLQWTTEHASDVLDDVIYADPKMTDVAEKVKVKSFLW